MNFTGTVRESGEGKRLDLFLSELLPDLSRSRIQKLIAGGHVDLNGAPCPSKGCRLREGDLVELTVPPPAPALPQAENICLDIVYEDPDLLVVNKPRGMVVHPSPGHSGGTLVNALLGYCRDLSGIGGRVRPGILHRLDKDTSGLLLVAKNDFSHQRLSEQLKKRHLLREYIALAGGRPPVPAGRIEAPVGRHPVHRKKMAVVANGKEAVTRFRVIGEYGPYSLLELRLETGRTHQIRVHLAHLGCPVVGDPLYGRGEKDDVPPELALPQALHAGKIAFVHPRSGQKMEFTAPLPPGFRRGLAMLKKRATGPGKGEVIE